MIIKCKMCGGDLEITEGLSVAECQYCGSKQTVPTADDEKKISLFARANRLRAACEFDKAAGIYESIVAEFSQEAEAYWGLVLCKYGIEYVDDPGTGKKVPTCHRSSFESVLDDANFEQACENADVIARKVYRDEAKQIEEIRKGIIAVSANEDPYDIFICYKETAEDGDRTLDSVIAQDIYDALTDKGYRVFFSRITLEDKLGIEYESYIFAALNSAKIMLAVGTDYEYYNAVWVKNEWSRYLKLMTTDKDKHLIPCFKNIDAYDMPKEFARLQAQDMGKVGAMQDLLRGIEKILPLGKAPVRESVVLQGGKNMLASLLDRGSMALDDGDWEKADGFFEAALNQNSKNPDAYLGKVFAEERCKSLEELVAKRLSIYENAKETPIKVDESTEYITEAVKQYVVPGYLSEEQLKQLYRCDIIYNSKLKNLNREVEELWWADHKMLSKAERFASGEFEKKLCGAKEKLFSRLNQLIEAARQEEQPEREDAEKQYAAFLTEKDAEVKTLYEESCRRREEDYNELLDVAEKESNIKALSYAAKAYENMGNYKDSSLLAKQCSERAAQLQATHGKKAEKKKKDKRSRTVSGAIIAAVLAVLIAVSGFAINSFVIKPNKYEAASELLADGQYAKAALKFAALGNYEDAKAKSLDAWSRTGNWQTISTSGSYIMGLKSDGTVVSDGDNNLGAEEFSNWSDVVAISAGPTHALGIRTDGTVVAAGNSKDPCDVDDWSDIVAISAGGSLTLGLKANGTVVSAGDNYSDKRNVTGWSDIVAISNSLNHSVGLKADGTVVATGYNEGGQCNVSDWTDIVAISTAANHTVGLKSDGTVVAVGETRYGACEVSNWTDVVAISAGLYHTVGLKSDGTVVAVGSDKQGQCRVSDWTDIVEIAANTLNTVGIKSDGTIVTVGSDAEDLCDLSEWTDMKLPAV